MRVRPLPRAQTAVVSSSVSDPGSEDEILVPSNDNRWAGHKAWEWLNHVLANDNRLPNAVSVVGTTAAYREYCGEASIAE